nr:hypothetical protein VDP59_000600 [Xanthomonas campestris pv. campestris]
MRLVRYLIVLIVLLSTSAWAAPTQPELPGAWARAALHTLPRSERDLKVLITLRGGTGGGGAPALRQPGDRRGLNGLRAPPPLSALERPRRGTGRAGHPRPDQRGFQQRARAGRTVAAARMGARRGDLKVLAAP